MEPPEVTENRPTRRSSLSLGVSFRRRCPFSFIFHACSNQLQTPQLDGDREYSEWWDERDQGEPSVVSVILAEALVMCYPSDMAFIVLRRSRKTRSYYLVESYRDDQGMTRRRNLCYLGREQDDTDTLAKALAHWQQAISRAKTELRKASGERRQVIRRRIEATEIRIGVIEKHKQLLALAETELRKQDQQAEEAVYWQCFERLRFNPTAENATAAKRAFLFLVKRHHPDQGGSHHDFLRVKDAYDRALAVWRRTAA